MIHRIEPDDDLSFVGERTHLWKVASMGRWHLAVRTAGGLKAPCGAGSVSDSKTLSWRGGMLVSLDTIAEKTVVWPMVCARCEEIL